MTIYVLFSSQTYTGSHKFVTPVHELKYILLSHLLQFLSTLTGKSFIPIVFINFFLFAFEKPMNCPLLYSTPQLHINYVNKCYFAVSAKCSSNSCSVLLLIYILSAVKTKLQNYCDSSYSRGGYNFSPVLSSFQICNKSVTTDATGGTGTMHFCSLSVYLTKIT